MTKYDRRASQKIGKVMHEYQQGELTSDASGKPVKSRKQAIAIGLSAAREAGAQLPPSSRRKSGA